MRRPCNPTLSLPFHGCGSFSSRPWRDLVTAVGRSHHGRGKVKIAVPSHNYTGILTELYRCPGITLPTVSYWFAYI
jgi:hypothetical protein